MIIKVKVCCVKQNVERGGGLNKYAALAQSFFACFSHIELVPQASALHWFAALA